VLGGDSQKGRDGAYCRVPPEGSKPTFMTGVGAGYLRLRSQTWRSAYPVVARSDSAREPTPSPRSHHTVEGMASTPRWVARPRAELVVPVVLIIALGATWITMHATGGRGATHTVFQVLALCECGIALLLRWRKPVGALASILVVYVLVDLDTITILPVLLALLTVAELRGRRTVIAAATATAVAVAVMPYLHGDAVSLGGRTLPHLAAVALSVALGLWLRARRRPG
jgi:hypothetical protein